MKKLMSVMLGLSLLLGVATVSSAQDDAKKEGKKKGGKKEGKKETILFNLSGHGHFDMASYTAYNGGKLTDQQYDEKELAMALNTGDVVMVKGSNGSRMTGLVAQLKERFASQEDRAEGTE